MSLSSNITFLLVEPKSAGNVGAAARAINNMGFKNLGLVNSQAHLEKEAEIFACSGEAILKKVRSFPEIREAIADAALVAGTSRRKGKKRGKFLDFEEGIKLIKKTAKKNKVVIVFGREDSGLSNEETEACSFLMTIPTGKKSSSLNLAQAVMLTAYELARENKNAHKEDTLKLSDQERIEVMFRELYNVLTLLGYSSAGNRDLRGSILRTMKDLFTRSGLTVYEVNMFLGLCRQITEKFERR